MKEHVIKISPDGEIEIEALGYRGKACTKATEAIERALGKVKARTHKPEFYQDNTQGQQAKQG